MGKSNDSILDILTKEKKLFVMLGVFVAAIVVGNVLGAKTTSIKIPFELPLFGSEIPFSVGIFAYPITFLITDMIEEVYGKKMAKVFFIAAFIALLFTMILLLLAVYLPPSTHYAARNEHYVKALSSAPRLIIGSFIAFVIAQQHDIWAFNFWKKLTKGKHLWLRNNLSTIVSQLIDSTVFSFIALLYITPKYTPLFIVNIIITSWLVKVVVSLIDTPFCYIGVKWLKAGRLSKIMDNPADCPVTD